MVTGSDSVDVMGLLHEANTVWLRGVTEREGSRDGLVMGGEGP